MSLQSWLPHDVRKHYGALLIMKLTPTRIDGRTAVRPLPPLEVVQLNARCRAYCVEKLAAELSRSISRGPLTITACEIVDCRTI